MKPQINDTTFGSIIIDGTKYDHDVLIRSDGSVHKRKKKLSKKKYGSSHKISREEAKHIYEKGTTHLIIGSGQVGLVTLSDEATAYFDKKDCTVHILKTPDAIREWNEREEGTIAGLFHVTC
ncbi:hypothetical protein GF407_14515 [candidate division KSB1 bacterium]|nr:hypothetical protein [candidate division KSB1 bacterium]